MRNCNSSSRMNSTSPTRVARDDSSLGDLTMFTGCMITEAHQQFREKQLWLLLVDSFKRQEGQRRRISSFAVARRGAVREYQRVMIHLTEAPKLRANIKGRCWNTHSNENRAILKEEYCTVISTLVPSTSEPQLPNTMKIDPGSFGPCPEQRIKHNVGLN